MARAELTEDWVARYNSPGGGEDAAYAMVVDGSGNVYVTGEVSSGADSHYATVKYDTHGNELWMVQYNTLGDNMNRATAIAIDASGNVYVTGWIDAPPGYVYRTGESQGYPGWDYATVKYDTHGNELWVKRYSGPGNGIDRATAIAVDASGNVYVTGESYGGDTGDDYATAKYDTHGNELWVKRYNGPGNDIDRAAAIAVDASGNVYVTGQSDGGGTSWDYATVKYDTYGNELWVKRYNGTGNDSDGASAIAVDPSGNVCVSGGSAGSGANFGYATVKYDTHGNELWVKRYEGLGYYEDGARGIAIDASGNVYVTGSIHDNGFGDSWADYATVKYDTNGNELWVKRYNGTESDGDWASAIAVDASGNVYVTGETAGSGTNRDYAMVKYDTNGNELWVKRYNGTGNSYDSASAIAVDALGNVYVTGESKGSGTGSDYATVKYREAEEVEVTMELPAGWSMISFPVTPAVTTLGALFLEAMAVYRYEKGMGYVQVLEGENLEVGVGYWILLDIPQSFVIKGTEITEYTMPVADGWYMIGGCSLLADKIITSGKIGVIYGYTQGVGYERLLGSEPLKPGKGYWILFSNTSEGAEFTASTSASQ